MKRDMELVRKLLLIVEDETYPNMVRISAGENGSNSASPIYKHFDLLMEAGLIRGNVSNHGGEEDGKIELYFIEAELTWKGHEFLDTVRDPDTWKKTKDGVKAIGGASMEFVWEIAKAYGKDLVKKRLGLDLS